MTIVGKMRCHNALCGGTHHDHKYIVACHLPRGSKLRWREDIAEGLPSVRESRVKITRLPTTKCLIYTPL